MSQKLADFVCYHYRTMLKIRPAHPGVGGAALLAALVALCALACTASADVSDIERREQQLNRSLMCPVCPGESIDQSRNPLSAQMRGVVRDRLEQGWSEDEIRAYFVESYGPSVVMEPPASGFSLLAWAMPAVALAGAAAALLVALRLMRRRGSPPPEEPPLSDEESKEYLARVEDAIASD